MEALEAGAKAKGAVKWFDERRGFGFVVLENTNQELFLHNSVLPRKRDACMTRTPRSPGFWLNSNVEWPFELTTDRQRELIVKAVKINRTRRSLTQRFARESTTLKSFTLAKSSLQDVFVV